MLTIPVSYVLETLATQEGLNLTTDGVDDVCFGMVISSDKSFSQVLRDNSAIYNFYIVDGDPIRLVRRAVNDDLTIDLTVNENECLRRSGTPAVTFSRVEPASLPRQIEIQYIDPDRDYAVTTQVARHMSAPRTNTQLSLSIDFVISAQQARDLAFDLLYRLWSQQLRLGFEHPNLAIEPGDVISLVTTQGTFTCVVAMNTINMPARTNTIIATILLSERATTSIVNAPTTTDGISKTVEGVVARGLVGALSVQIGGGKNVDLTPSSVVATSHVGTITVTAGNNIRVDIPGSGAVGAAGTITVTITTPATKWNPSDELGTITLSGSNLIATSASGGSTNCGVRADTGKTSGKLYAEFTMTSGGANFSSSFDTGVGLATLAANLTNWVGGGAVAGFAVFVQSGQIFLNGSSTGKTVGSALSSGDVICMAVDFGNMRGWFRKNGGSWNNDGTADPASNVGGVDISGVFGSTSAFPMAGFYQNGDSNSANFGTSSFAQTKPSGFSNWG
jgi:hypothetical protein